MNYLSDLSLLFESTSQRLERERQLLFGEWRYCFVRQDWLNMKLILQMMPQPRRTKSLSSTVLQTFVAISSGKKRTILFRWLFLGTLNFSKETYFLLIFTFARWKASLSRLSIIANIEGEEVNHNSRFRIQTQRSLTATVIFGRSVKNVMQYLEWIKLACQ